MVDIAPRESLMRTEAERIVAEGERRHIHLRLLGAIAFQCHCPKYRFLSAKLNRVLSDVDFAGYGRDRIAISQLMKGLGYVDDAMLTALFGHKRMIWDNGTNGLHVDIFLDKLEMNHDIDFARRLEVENLSIPLADMLLEKLQIVKIEEKDIIDTIMLLREHALANQAPETVDVKYIARLLAGDWGFYHTVAVNLEKVQTRLAEYDALTVDDKADVSGKIKKLLQVINDEPKTMSWKIRAKVGTKSKWYRDVEDVNR
jgi:hypothetical protein